MLKKRILSLALVLVMTLGLLCLPAMAAEEAEDPQKEFEIAVMPTEHGKLKVTAEKAKVSDAVYIEVDPEYGYELAELFVLDWKGNNLKVELLPDGWYVFNMPYEGVLVDGKFREKGQKQPEEQPEKAENPFTDVAEGDWFYDAVLYNREKGIMDGVDGEHFNPDGTLTRAMVVTMLYRLAGEPGVSGSLSFTDVEEDQWYTDAIVWATQKGIAEGYTEETFGPQDPVTREQLAKLIYGYVQTTGKGLQGQWAIRLDFTDGAEVSEWAYEPMCWCVISKIITGDNGRLLPQGPAARAQAAAMFMRLLELDKK